MTAKEARDTLPTVLVKIKGKDYIMFTAGRKNKFATVYDNEGRMFEYSWDAIARSISDNTCLIA